VPALEAQVLDVSAGGLRHPEPVQCEQRDQRMLGRRAEPGGHQQGAQLVPVQGGGMGLVVQPRPPHMRGRGMVQETFLDCVLVNPAMVHSLRVTVARARPLASSSLAKPSMSVLGRRTGPGSGCGTSW
jgi:hypothetical protein